jgi:hypothetical protein
VADNSISGLYRILPTYPVKPSQPANKDRENDEQKQKPHVPEVPEAENPAERQDDDDQPVIDEYV